MGHWDYRRPECTQPDPSIRAERLAHLRRAFRGGRISFPSQLPVFARQYCPEIQWRIAALYFVHGWSCAQLAHRYQVTSSRIRQSLRSWVDASVTTGYIQWIPAEAAVVKEPVRVMAAGVSQNILD